MDSKARGWARTLDTLDSPGEPLPTAEFLRTAERVRSQVATRIEQTTKDRNLAALVLYRRHGWKPISVYGLLGMTRQAWRQQILRREPAVLPDVPNPELAVRRHVRTLAELGPLLERARAARDAGIRRLHLDAAGQLQDRVIAREYTVDREAVRRVRRALEGEGLIPRVTQTARVQTIEIDVLEAELDRRRHGGDPGQGSPRP